MPDRLEENTIYAALYRGDDGRYNWALILAQSASEGLKLHSTNIPNPTKWHYEQERYSLDEERKPLVLILAKLDVPHTHPVNLLQEIPLETPPSDLPKVQAFTRRIWFRQGIRRLSSAGLVQCPSVDALERKLVDPADGRSNLVALGIRPWKLHQELRSSR
ncbi:hypothetical protein DAEQUDRAFT_733290 [Daedalea quercina L-15889]|uniref:Uncharacterized protein n=1 Tax=Daedalea quercina L-15889 TaxID=1314783 RepID=A0A165L4Y2_9APHY|nr:hypothetical protein DAEQUDRAFT_733290 [Daedalea quercina L-15889]